MLTGKEEVWHLVVLSVCLGLIHAFDVPTRQSFLPQLIEKREDLGNAIALKLFHGPWREIAGALPGRHTHRRHGRRDLFSFECHQFFPGDCRANGHENPTEGKNSRKHPDRAGTQRRLGLRFPFRADPFHLAAGRHDQPGRNALSGADARFCQRHSFGRSACFWFSCGVVPASAP